MEENKGTEENLSKSGENLPKSSKLIAIIAVIAVVVIAILVGVIIMLFKQVNSKPEQPPQQTRATVSSVGATVAGEDNLDELLANINDSAEDSSYVCTMNVDWNFKDASQPSYNATVMNSTDNKRTVYFDLALVDDMSVLYSSPYIPVGEMVNDITLNTGLEAGSYPAYVIYHMVDDDKNEVGSVTVEVMLHIEN